MNQKIIANNLYRVEMCGGIASGKTTFSTLLSEVDFECIYESFASNPFWEAFYSDPGSYIFETEMTFTLQHYHQIKRQAELGKSMVCDYSFLLDLAYAEIGLKGSQLTAFKTVYAEIKKELPPPALIIHLQCDPETELARIRARGREVEKNITIDFLMALNKAVSEQIEKTRGHVPILTIDSAKNNFVEDEDVRVRMLKMVSDTLQQNNLTA